MDIKELKRRMRLDLSEEKIESILYHPSCLGIDPLLRKRNKLYVSFGNSIIIVAYAIYLYRNSSVESCSDLFDRIRSSHLFIQSKLYEQFNLEDFVRKDLPEFGKKHPEIAAKIIVILYQEKGFLQAYEYLEKFFPLISGEKSIDYKSEVLQYVQAKRLFCEYKIIDEAGPEHEKIFTCQLTIGKNRVVASSAGRKKDAEAAAAKEFFRTFNIPTVKVKNKKQPQTLGDIKVSNERKAQIEAAISLFMINKEFVKIEQISQVLTHKSYANNYPHHRCNNNEILFTIGAYIVDMLCYDYLLENDDLEHCDVIKEKSLLLREENLGKTIPDQWLEYFLRDRASDNIKSKMRYKIDILKSLTAVLFLNGVNRQSSAIFEECRWFVFEKLKGVGQDKILDYRSFLQDIAQKHKLTVEFNTKEKNGNPMSYATKVFVRNSATLQSTTVGYGLTKKEATNNASKDMLIYLVKYVGEDEQSKEAIFKYLEPETRCLLERKNELSINELSSIVDSQKRESDLFMPAVQKPARLINNNRNLYRNNSIENIKEASFEPLKTVLYICKDDTVCEKNHHNITSVSGYLYNIRGEKVKISIKFCSSCNSFFISLNEYKHCKNIYGVLFGKFSFKCFNSGTNTASNDELAEESILNLCGYTVSQAENLRPFERHLILGNIMDREILEKDDIIACLESLINNGKNNSDMRLAVIKWKNDQKWAQNYKIDFRRKFDIEDMKRYQ